MENILIVGAFGFIGFHLTKTLLEQGITVHTLDLSNYEKNDKISEEKLYEIGRNANLLYVDSLPETEQLDAIFLCIDQEGLEDENYVKAFHSQLSKSIKWCQAHSTKLVFTSTLSVVSHNAPTITEETECEPLNHIGDLFLLWEKEILEENKMKPFSYIINRFPTLYGPWQPEQYAYQQALLLEIKEQPIKKLEDIYTKDILFITDAIQAIIKSASISSSEIFHITSGKSDQWEKGLSLILGEGGTLQSSNEIKLSNEKALELLAFYPTVTLEEGISLQRAHLLQRRTEL